MAVRRPEPPAIDLQLACDAPGLPSKADLAEWLALSVELSDVQLTPASELSIRIVEEQESRALNSRYRGRDRSTNVLSFPAELDSLPGLPTEDGAFLGDIVICAAIVEREAGEQEKDVAAHWTHMLVHGFLHLLGFDHVNDAEARTMEALEVRILAAKGLSNPYKDRDSS